MANTKPTFVVTNPVRLSYANLLRPYAREGQEAKYSTTILIPKNDVATLQRINAAIEASAQEGTTSKWGGQRPPKLDTPLHDGDGGRPSDGMPFGAECRGHYVLTASSKQRPEVVDVNLNPIINESDVYSGMLARVSLNFFSYNSNGKKGVGCGLGNVQKTGDGEPLGGRTTAASDFGDGMQAPVAAAPSYAAPAQPQYSFSGQVNPNTGEMMGYQPPAQPQYAQSGYPQYQQSQINPLTGQPYGQ